MVYAHYRKYFLKCKKTECYSIEKNKYMKNSILIRRIIDHFK